MVDGLRGTVPFIPLAVFLARRASLPATPCQSRGNVSHTDLCCWLDWVDSPGAACTRSRAQRANTQLSLSGTRFWRLRFLLIATSYSSGDVWSPADSSRIAGSPICCGGGDSVLLWTWRP